MENMGLNTLLKEYRGKKVLVTGHTGFKGSWLCLWLKKLGADIIGIGLDPKSDRDNFFVSNVQSIVTDIRLDIRNSKTIHDLISEEQPEIVFHLAAQPIVLEGYMSPLETFETNTMGTVNILEAVRKSLTVKTAIFITTDKVYENQEWFWPYREDDRLGGYDPYSASKGVAELIISSYRNSFFNIKDYNKHGKSIASVRAGNVIGGGDWTTNRIVPDCIKALENKIAIKVRNPKSVRPWQHVLEPLGGYLLLGAKMMLQPTKFAEAWNFGPEAEGIFTVGQLVDLVVKYYGEGIWEDISVVNAPHEAKLLALDINKAKYQLGWKPVLKFEDTVRLTIEWYKNFRQDDGICNAQIDFYLDKMISLYEN